MERVVAVYSIVVGILVLAMWAVSLARHQVPELATNPWEIRTHISAESIMAATMLVDSRRSRQVDRVLPRWLAEVGPSDGAKDVLPAFGTALGRTHARSIGTRTGIGACSMSILGLVCS